jgi:hypothetical protein
MIIQYLLAVYTAYSLFTVVHYVWPQLRESKILVILGLIAIAASLIIWVFNVYKGERLFVLGFVFVVFKPVYIVFDTFTEPLMQFFYALF